MIYCGSLWRFSKAELWLFIVVLYVFSLKLCLFSVCVHVFVCMYIRVCVGAFARVCMYKGQKVLSHVFLYCSLPIYLFIYSFIYLFIFESDLAESKLTSLATLAI